MSSTTKIKRTFICTAGDQNFRFHVKISVKLRTIEVSDSLAKARASSGVRIMIRRYSLQGLFSSFRDPLRGPEIHEALAKADTIRGQIGRTISFQLIYVCPQ
jgi:hypothetical protein